MNYDEIYRPLSRTSFASKMGRAFYASIETMSQNGQIESDILRTKLLPEEIETFVLNSVVANEYSDRVMTDKQFIEVMNAIRNYQPPEYYEKLKKDHLKWILPTIGAVQFESQEYSYFRLYRHHCLFSFMNEHVDVDGEFRKKFDHSFDEYAAIVMTIQVLLAQKSLFANKDYLEKLNLRAPWFFENLMLTREQYKKELSQFAKDKADYKYCLRPSYSYPFIEYQGKFFLPTPHLLIQSITTAMMNRLTFENLDLREKIGKNACEGYLLKMVKDSGLFDEVKAEYEYAKGQRTLDIMARKGKIGLLIDSKLFSPKVSLRTYDEDSYERDVDRIVKALRQAYIQARDKFQHDYNPFDTDVEDVYALVVAYQEGYLDLGEIYTRTAQKLSIAEDSAEFNWLWRHIGFTDVATIGRFLLTSTDIIPEVTSHEVISDKWLTGRNGSNLTEEVRHYQDKLTEDALKILHELYHGDGKQLDNENQGIKTITLEKGRTPTLPDQERYNQLINKPSLTDEDREELTRLYKKYTD